MLVTNSPSNRPAATDKAHDDAKWVIKASGVGGFDELSEKAVLELRRPSQIISFWDVEAVRA